MSRRALLCRSQVASVSTQGWHVMVACMQQLDCDVGTIWQTKFRDCADKQHVTCHSMISSQRNLPSLDAQSRASDAGCLECRCASCRCEAHYKGHLHV